MRERHVTNTWKMAALLQGTSKFAFEFASSIRPLVTSRSLSVERKFKNFEVLHTTEENGNLRQENKVVFIPNRKPATISLQEALQALRAYSLSWRDETVEVSLFCNLFKNRMKTQKRDPFRGSVVYPHLFGREPKVLVFANAESLEAAKNAGASVVGGTELVPQISSRALKGRFDHCLAVTDIYEKLKPFQKTLRKHMPTPKKGRVVELSELPDAVSVMKKAKEYKCDKQGNCNAAIGKLRFEDYQIEENLRLLVSLVLEHRNKQPKGAFIQAAVLSSTYGPGFDVSVSKYIE